MTDADKIQLTAERDAIKKRIGAAKEPEAATLKLQFGERLAHLEARVAETPPELTPG